MSLYFKLSIWFYLSDVKLSIIVYLESRDLSTYPTNSSIYPLVRASPWTRIPEWGRWGQEIPCNLAGDPWSHDRGKGEPWMISLHHIYLCMYIQVVPGRAGGGSFRRKKNYIAKKEFAYRMCARWPTIAMSKLFFGFEQSFGRCMAVMSCALGWCVCDLTCFQMMWLVVRWFVVLPQRTTPVLLCTLYYKVLPQYYSVLQSTTPVPLCTTKYYSGTTLYYKVLLQYYSPVLQRTTLYYKVLLQYYSVLQSTTPVLPSTTKYYSVLQSTTRYYSSTTLYYNVLLCTTPVLQRTTLYYQVLQSTTPVLLCTTKYYSSTTLYYKVLRQYYSYYKVLLRYYSVLQSTTPVLLCTTQYYASTTLYYPVLQRTTLYCKVLQRTTPVLLCTTKYYSSTTLYYKVLRQYYSSTT